MELKISTNPIWIHQLESTYLNPSVPDIRVGDTLKLGVSITEGNKERVQFTEGVVISKNNGGLNTTITLRRVMQGVGVERVYLIHSPKIKSIEVEQVKRLAYNRALNKLLLKDLTVLE
jgi:large subunit ribosomal protein L19